jgi:hypothetical protein
MMFEELILEESGGYPSARSLAFLPHFLAGGIARRIFLPSLKYPPHYSSPKNTARIRRKKLSAGLSAEFQKQAFLRT